MCCYAEYPILHCYCGIVVNFKKISFINAISKNFCSLSVSFKLWKFQSCNTNVMTKDEKVNIAVT
jgi:hypothetical protein